jgi:arsenite-transporting ATPase
MMGLEIDDEDMFSKLGKTKELIDEVNQQFKNPDLTTFVCVCIPEFLSVYETERLLQELTKFEMDSHNLVVNQVLFPNPGMSLILPCPCSP